jgi:hypothetical protein
MYARRWIVVAMALAAMAWCATPADAQRRPPQNARGRRDAQGNKQAPSDVLYKDAQAALRAREFERAAGLLEQALKANPSPTSRAYILNDLGEAYYELERFEEARTAFEQALSIQPNFVRAQANLEVVKWSIALETRPTERLSSRETIEVQIAGGYVTGLGVGLLLNISAGILGYRGAEGVLPLMGAGFVIGSTLRVPELAKEWSYGHGAARNALAGALLPPATGVLVVLLRDESPSTLRTLRGAAIGAALSPLGATLGYALSTGGVWGRPSRHRPTRAGDQPLDPTDSTQESEGPLRSSGRRWAVPFVRVLF